MVLHCQIRVHTNDAYDVTKPVRHVAITIIIVIINYNTNSEESEAEHVQYYSVVPDNFKQGSSHITYNEQEGSDYY